MQTWQMQNKSHVHFRAIVMLFLHAKVSNTCVLHLQYEHILLTSEYLEEISRNELYRIHV
jgi:hypothetical protein